MGYGDAPWVFTGRALYQLHLVPVAEARKHVPPEFKLVSLFGCVCVCERGVGMRENATLKNAQARPHDPTPPFLSFFQLHPRRFLPRPLRRLPRRRV